MSKKEVLCLGCLQRRAYASYVSEGESCRQCGWFAFTQAANPAAIPPLHVVLPRAKDLEWIANLRQELMRSKSTHNFSFSRDEVLELLAAGETGSLPDALQAKCKNTVLGADKGAEEPSDAQKQFLDASIAFAKAHIHSDDLEALDDADPGAIDDSQMEDADDEYNRTKRALVVAYKTLAASPQGAAPCQHLVRTSDGKTAQCDLCGAVGDVVNPNWEPKWRSQGAAQPSRDERSELDKWDDENGYGAALQGQQAAPLDTVTTLRWLECSHCHELFCTTGWRTECFKCLPAPPNKG